MRALEEARVLVVGAGGLGCPASLALARAGLCHLTLVDPDRVDVTNLHRQLWHRGADVGRWKVDSAAEGLARAFPALQVERQVARVDASNAPALFAAHDVVLDATDGTATKFLLSDLAKATRVPLVYAGVLRMQGQAMRIEPEGPCLRCLFEEPPDPEAVPTCAQAGVLGAMAGWVGALQAQLALESLAGAEVGPAAALHVLDGAQLRSRTLRVERVAGCPGCAGTASGVPWEELRCQR
ncbi:ThiF family adenylyltransferase [Aggregicoccus sp. 17bor-14]|uniref:HesA/MoeB/ThiF family protein n=1 Tax=Myxococcaceae TaxID=31 RepID=UPI00351A4063